eukprot:7536820-Prorocentrum_lima.AAC.1
MKNQNVPVPYLAAPGQNSPRGGSPGGARKNSRKPRRGKKSSSPRTSSSSSSRSRGKGSLKAMPCPNFRDGK